MIETDNDPGPSSAPIIRPVPESGCLFIEGDLRDPDWRWCGKTRATRADGAQSPYCSEHSRVAYVDFKEKRHGAD